MQRLNRLDSPKLPSFNINSFKGKRNRGNDNSNSSLNFSSWPSSANTSPHASNLNLAGQTKSMLNNVWENLSIPLEDAIVYLDTAILQVLKYSSEGGVDILFENGAVNVKDINKISENDNEIISYNNNNSIYIK